MNNKNYKFLTFKEQINHLRNNRHLMIGDYEKLTDFLSKYNYDNLVNSYNNFFLKAENRNEYKNCNSDFIIYLFIFDKKISIKILKSVLDIERQISTAIVYLLPKIYKEKIDKISRGEILTLTSFEWDLIFPNFYDNKNKIKINASDLTKYIKDSKGYLIEEVRKRFNSLENVHLWCLSIYWTFGTLIKIFKSLDFNVQGEIVKFIFKNNDISNVEFIHFLEMINRLRNRLCHNNMVYEFNFLDHNKKIIDFYYKLTGINTKHIRIK